MARKCMLTGKRPNVANKVSHSNRKSKKRQLPNLQARRFWWAEGDCFVRLRVSTRAMRTIDKVGLNAFATREGVDLSKYRVDGPTEAPIQG
ncbi:MAG: 50S ribosomal protein L28 [Myxococcota bacterium]